MTNSAVRWFILIMVLNVALVRAQELKQTRNSQEFIVAADGTGHFTSIQKAIEQCKAFPSERIFIRLKPGTYREKVEVFSWNTNIALIGEDPATTIITFDDYSGKGNINTFTSWTFKVMGNDFIAVNITFENSAGPVGQAVALHVEADRAVFRNCRFIGNQDTIYTGGENSRQYFSDCYIEGTTDFIFGAATAVFENCRIHSKKHSYITAASTTRGKSFGYVFLTCNLTAAEGITRVYLGRPWRDFARTVYIRCQMGSHILPEGWHNWNKSEAEQTVFYAEYKSHGPGAVADKRVSWSKQLNDKEAEQYTVANILKGSDNWVPE
jgi:pectinesterase